MTWKKNGSKRKICAAVIARDGHRCHWCQRETRPVPAGNGSAEPDYTTVDHVIPRGQGGSDEMSNLVVACYDCNQRRDRGSKTGDPAGAGPITERELVALMS